MLVQHNWFSFSASGKVSGCMHENLLSQIFNCNLVWPF
jgi:hypothetical protein